MSDIRFNRWLHQSGTGGVSQDSSGNIGIGTTVPTMALDIRGDVNIGDTININNASGIISATTFTGTTGTFSGNVSAVDATFTGNVTIGGTLTYEDVSNIDAVGIITAQSDIIVGGGLTVTGISTFNNDVKLLDNDKLKFGIGEDLQIYHDSANGQSIIVETGPSVLKIQGSDLRLSNSANTADYLQANDGAAVKLFYNGGAAKFETTNTGAVVTGILTATTFSGNLAGNVTGDLTGNLAGISSIASISSSISDTAVDVFVYDTSKDSDGGAWRKRTQNTSWYNETLGTATRGSRREFPAVAVIVAETSKVTIYDGDDPDMPMWMVFNATAARSLIGYQSANVDSIKALNASLVVGATSELNEINFLRDDSFRIGSTASWYTTNNISQRNVNFTSFTDDGRRTVGGGDYYVAMTVLPNASDDSATGLPIPTIAVGTAGGISVITDSGTVVDMYPNDAGEKPILQIGFTKSNKLIFRHNFNWVYYYEIPNSDLNAAYWNGLSGYIGRFTSVDRVWDTNYKGIPVNAPSNTDITEFLEDRALGHTNGLDIIDINNGGLLGYGMHAGIATNFNTGYQHGDIKGAFLSDTSTTNVTGSEKIANYNFAADFSTQWEVKNSANTSYDATNDRVTVTSTQNYSGIRLKGASLPTLTQGKRYVMTVDIHSINNPIRFGIVSGGTKDSVNSTGSHTLTFTAQASVSEVYVEKPTGSNSTFVLNSVSIREAEEDRSVNNKGLQVFGTVTKTAVATGAELVAYSGFGNSNYLEQPYNTDLNFGTGDFSLMNWIYVTAGGDYQVVFDRWSPNGGNARFYYGLDSSERIFFNHREDASSNATTVTGSTVLLTGVWHHMAAVRRGTFVEVYLDGKLDNSATSTVRNVTPGSTQPILRIGNNAVTSPSDPMLSKLALLRISGSAPSAEQIKKIYDDEKFLFQENVKATLYGSSDAVTGLAFDDTTNLLYVGTSAGRSEFQGLRRINNTTDAVTTAISASNGLVAEQ